MEITYTKARDYLIPDIRLKDSGEKPIGKYGQMRKAYLKEELFSHLQEIDETVYRRLDEMLPQMTAQAEVSEEVMAQGYLSCLNDLPTGYPDAQAALAARLGSCDFLSILRGEYVQLYAAYAQDRSLLRFYYHKPEELWRRQAS